MPSKQPAPYFARLGVAVLVGVVFVACNPMRGCAGSRFNLKPESRLPKWFSVPAEQSRDRLNVTLAYYPAPLANVDDTVIQLQLSGQDSVTATGRYCWHPAMREKTNANGGFDSGSYPHYVIVTANGVTEVVEHVRMEPYFAVTDDAAIVRQAMESVSKGECRKSP